MKWVRPSLWDTKDAHLSVVVLLTYSFVFRSGIFFSLFQACSNTGTWWATPFLSPTALQRCISISVCGCTLQKCPPRFLDSILTLFTFIHCLNVQETVIHLPPAVPSQFYLCGNNIELWITFSSPSSEISSNNPSERTNESMGLFLYHSRCFGYSRWHGDMVPTDFSSKKTINHLLCVKTHMHKGDYIYRCFLIISKYNVYCILMMCIISSVGGTVNVSYSM